VDVPFIDLGAKEVDLLDCIRRKVLGLSFPGLDPSGLPQTNLNSLNLRSLLALVRSLGRRWLLAQPSDPAQAADQVLSSAACALADWPRNFYQLLNSLQAESLPDGFVRITRAPFRGIYQSLLGTNRVIEPKGDAEFLRIAFQEFFVEHRARGLVDEKLMRGLHTENFSRYLRGRNLQDVLVLAMELPLDC
jgi:hypothetical protein